MKTTIGIIIAVLIIGGGVWWFMQGDTEDATNTSVDTSSDMGQSINDIMASGDSMVCTFRLSDENGDQSWTTYVDGTRVRGDYAVMPLDGGDAWEGHIITDTEWHYNWGNYDGTVYGTKMKLADFEADDTTTEDVSETPTSADIAYDQDVSMDCDSWNVDEDVFDPPTDVTFTDLSAQMEQMSEMSDDFKASACAACDSGDDPEACKAALGCS